MSVYLHLPWAAPHRMRSTIQLPEPQRGAILTELLTFRVKLPSGIAPSPVPQPRRLW